MNVTYTVRFKEDQFIRCLYTDSRVYSQIGQEFCTVFDKISAKTVTEAIAESFYRVVEKQEMDGGQSLVVLGNHAKVDWCFPSIIQCECSLTEMAKAYIDGYKSLGLQQPIYQRF